jgi:hypothetical protein
VLSRDRFRQKTHTDKTGFDNSKALEEDISAFKAGSFPFGYVREKLPDFNCTCRKDPRSAITEMLDAIGEVILKTVFNVGYAGESE